MRLRVRLFVRRYFCATKADRGDLQGVGSEARDPWGIEGAWTGPQHLFPAMAKAHCRTVMFGIESGSQRILDRLKEEQTLEEVATAVRNAKQAGIEIVHGFFTVGNPDETIEDMNATFDLASKLPLDTFGFNRLCCMGDPLGKRCEAGGSAKHTIGTSI